MVYLAIALVVLALALAFAWRARGEDPDADAKWSSAGGVVSDGTGNVALVLQRDKSRARRLRWTLPKGRIDPGETAETAALREVHEESGLRARIVAPLMVHEGPRHFTHYFEMALLRDDGTHDAETREVRFVSIKRAAKMVRSERDLLVLRRLVEQRTRTRLSG